MPIGGRAPAIISVGVRAWVRLGMIGSEPASGCQPIPLKRVPLKPIRLAPIRLWAGPIPLRPGRRPLGPPAPRRRILLGARQPLKGRGAS